MWDALFCLVLHRFVNGPSLLFRLLALRPYINEYSRQHVEHLEALELSDWDALKAVYKVLGLVREMTERLEGEQIPTRSRAPKYLWQFVCVMAQRSPSDSVPVLTSQQCIAASLGWAMGYKVLTELDNPNWVLAMVFMAYTLACRPECRRVSASWSNIGGQRRPECQKTGPTMSAVDTGLNVGQLD